MSPGSTPPSHSILTAVWSQCYHIPSLPLFIFSIASVKISATHFFYKTSFCYLAAASALWQHCLRQSQPPSSPWGKTSKTIGKPSFRQMLTLLSPFNFGFSKHGRKSVFRRNHPWKFVKNSILCTFPLRGQLVY